MGKLFTSIDADHRDFILREPLGVRQIIRLDVRSVRTSCGFGVPLLDYVGERGMLDRWAQAKGEIGLETYRREKNVQSIDGLPTGLLDDVEGVVD
jgi:hypothetical protein